MSGLKPRAFDIETSGLEPGSVVTVAGVATELGSWMVLNTKGRKADAVLLESQIEREAGGNVSIEICGGEKALLESLSEFCSKRIDGNKHYLTAYNGETWSGGFDLPFVRSACVRHGVDWPFPDIAYADTMDMMNRFDTEDENGLVGVYDALIGEEDCDPFVDSGEAVSAFEQGDWRNLLKHNLADIRKTRQLAVLAGKYIPKSDFKMKNLSPPNR